MESTQQKLVRTRGPFGEACLYLFVIFNIAMAVAFFGVVASPPPAPRVNNFGELLVLPIGMAIGHAVLIGQIIILWSGGFVALGTLTLLTRGRKRPADEAETQPQAAAIRKPEPSRVWYV